MVLGDHVRQAGSQVTQQGFRFDFTHFAPLTQKDISQVVQRANDIIADVLPVTAKIKPLDEAIREGTIALFGEKYDSDAARVVEIEGFSKELCGGCHVANTADIEVIVITSETGIAAGVRRIEGLSGSAAVKYLIHRHNIVTDLAALLHVQPNDIINTVTNMQNHIKESEKELKTLKYKEATAKALQALKDTNVKRKIYTSEKTIEIKVVSARMDSMAIEDLRNVVDAIAAEVKTNTVILVGSVYDGKVNFACRVTSDLTYKFKAGALIKEVAKVTGGSGGGRDDAAQAGGKDVSQIDAALEKIYELLQ
jgi:alanyl-tRNA synthetase